MDIEQITIERANKRLERWLNKIEYDWGWRETEGGWRSYRDIDKQIAEKFNLSAQEIKDVLNKAMGFVRQGAHIETTNYNGKTLLIFAAEYDLPEIVKELLERDANRNHQDLKRQTAMDYAISKLNPECVRHILTHPPTITKAQMQERTKWLWEMLYVDPLFAKRLEITELLAANCADMESLHEYTGKHKKTMLLLATERADHDMVLTLGFLGADITATTSSGKTAADINQTQLENNSDSFKKTKIECTKIALELLPHMIKNLDDPQIARNALEAKRVEYRLRGMQNLASKKVSEYLTQLDKRFFAKENNEMTWTPYAQSLFKSRKRALTFKRRRIESEAQAAKTEDIKTYITPDYLGALSPL
ncbi:MAG: ankyrin repeat domain-containing protein [Alphaproteobacteria bacterium]|nr:ankyrin repeat domain-containing protein [Alphaproteobacteria bacterium]